jgi:hypothetical protein
MVTFRKQKVIRLLVVAKQEGSNSIPCAQTSSNSIHISSSQCLTTSAKTLVPSYRLRRAITKKYSTQRLSSSYNDHSAIEDTN